MTGTAGELADGDAYAELYAIAVALRSELEWLRETGVVGLSMGARIPPEPSRSAPPSLLVESPVAGQVELEERPAVETRARLKVLADAAAACTACGLHAGRKQAVFARGDGSSGVCFVGEGPGADEDAQGYPFVGKAGQLLDKMIAAMGLERDTVYVCNVVKCRPPDNRKPEPEEVSSCVPFLHQQLELLAPRVIVALGATAVEGLLGVSGGITRLRGSFRLYQGRIPVMPTFHPAYLLRNPSAKKQVWEDLQAVMQSVGLTPPSREG
jgi:uracil-DNA glycosylase family 4